jgi:hypothetical protein
VLPRFDELDTGAGDEVFDRARDEHFAWVRGLRHPRSDVHGDPAGLTGHHLALTGLQPGADLEPELP